MACHFNDNVYTTVFTPREYQVELLDTAKESNTIVCLASNTAKVFIAVKLVQELAADIRRKNGKHTVLLLDAKNIDVMSSHLRHLTNLSVGQFSDAEVLKTFTGEQWFNENAQHNVYIMTNEICLLSVIRGFLSLSAVNLLIVDDCRLALKENSLRQLFREYSLLMKDNQPRVLGLTTITLSENLDLATLEAEFEHMEQIMHCKVNTCSDIVTVLRYCNKPIEKIIVCANQSPCALSQQLEELVHHAKCFLSDHRYDPYEIYEEEFLDELQGVPDPKLEPLRLLDEFLDVLHNLGPWCADKAAFALLMRIESMKVKTPYERHYLLLCLVSSILVKARALCNDLFEECNENDRLSSFSTPKVLRLLEILKAFRPESCTKTLSTETQVHDVPVSYSSDLYKNNSCNNSTTGLDVIKNDDCDKENNQSNSGLEPVNINIPILKKCFKGRTAKNNRNKANVGPRNRPNIVDPDSLCAIVFVEKRFTAKVLFYLINELSHSQQVFSHLSVQYTVEKVANTHTDSREAEMEHRKQEEVLKKFRMHECNLLIATSVLEDGIDVPKCNLVVRFDRPITYNSYVQCKGRAKIPDAYYLLMTEQSELQKLVQQLAQFMEIEKMLLNKCNGQESSDLEENESDLYTSHIGAYMPKGDTGASVTAATAIALVNRYCAKLPSDTFTRLTPMWHMHTCHLDNRVLYYCSIRLPINSPLKQTVTGALMPNRVLAKRMAAFSLCKLLHQMGELDDNLLPVGKETFKAYDEDWNSFLLEERDEILTKNNLEPRPGTTKRRQYYYKKIANSLSNCRPLVAHPAYLYLINMTLTCPLPEEQNTRGRKIYPPEESVQGFGILTRKQIPKICPFPIFTRSGEVRVSLELASTTVILTQEQLEEIHEFLNYIFTSVLRLQKYLMLFDPQASENSYFIVPTRRDDSGSVNVDWQFLHLIFENRNLNPHIIPEEERKNFEFHPEKYQDAVVMPWYRNQDQPQYFYVAEICTQLHPRSSFPGSDYKTFEEYYFKKYNIQIQNLKQPLLDVDHTSARLNFLTPRYVNRKGVALPTSSEETKRAKRENLEQKQILVPELCTVHPFPSSLWRKAVCLPCILYRINALLLADQIRKQVAEDLALGQEELFEDFEWMPLTFGWSLSDVLKKSKENKAEPIISHINVSVEDCNETDENIIKNVESNDISKEDGQEKSKSDTDWMEIGTWSNEMAGSCDLATPSTDDNWESNPVRYGSPTSWMQQASFNNYYDYDSDDSCESYSSDQNSSDNSNKSTGLRIEFKGDNVAEAIDCDSEMRNRNFMLRPPDEFHVSSTDYRSFDDEQAQIEKFHVVLKQNEKNIMLSEMIVKENETFILQRKKFGQATQTNEELENLITESLKNVPDDINTETALINDSIEKSQTFQCNESIEFENFSFDSQPDLNKHPGPSPSVILQALTMSNANDGINLERLETIGDSFLKYAITNYLYSTYDTIHEGKLSHLRSKQVSNLNLYRLGRLKMLGESMIATKFDPHDNWLPPCYYVPKELEQALIDAKVPANHWNGADMPTVRDMSKDEICEMVREKGEKLNKHETQDDNNIINLESLPCFIPYNLITQHSIPDKSVADCVEALIGAYLIECGPRGALLFMAWLGIRVLPKLEVCLETIERPVGSLPCKQNGNKQFTQLQYGHLSCPSSPLLHHCAQPHLQLEQLLDGYETFEESIQYNFKDRSYLLQALTHASYKPNTITDCYQRLEFLGDAVLDYLITRHLYEDPRLHSPGALTDLRSALVNNTIFASLAVRHGFHKYFRHLSPGLHDVINRFVQIQEENGHSISEEYYLIAEDESEEIEDVEVPKALGDVFESVAGAIFLDSGMCLDAVWKVYYRMMHNEIEQFSTNVPKSPIRELLELEPETAKFGKPEKLADGRRVRVTVEVFGKGIFKGIGRNYRIAKCTAAKCALKQLKKRGLLLRKN